ncbi:hypothetical protein QBC43DRAFT_28786 [Cladorrhinum sp. PSN259]|nr:hypothetical protein QBC43DRAFT_28786 [Cladorrhinum sp. PSN259]
MGKKALLLSFFACIRVGNRHWAKAVNQGQFCFLSVAKVVVVFVYDGEGGLFFLELSFLFLLGTHSISHLRGVESGSKGIIRKHNGRKPRQWRETGRPLTSRYEADGLQNASLYPSFALVPEAYCINWEFTENPFYLGFLPRTRTFGLLLDEQTYTQNLPSKTSCKCYLPKDELAATLYHKSFRTNKRPVDRRTRCAVRATLRSPAAERANQHKQNDLCVVLVGVVTFD